MYDERYIYLRYEILFELLFSERSFYQASYSLIHPSATEDWQYSERELLSKIPGIHLEHLNELRDELIANPAHGLKSYQDILRHPVVSEKS